MSPSPNSHKNAPANTSTATISTLVLSMVSSIPSGGGDPRANTQVTKPLTFARMDQFDHDRLNRAQNNELAKAVYQRPDQYEKGSTLEKLEERAKRHENIREKVARNTTKDFEKEPANEWGRGTEKGTVLRSRARAISKPLKILGQKRNPTGVVYEDDRRGYNLSLETSANNNEGGQLIRKRQRTPTLDSRTTKIQATKRFKVDTSTPIDPRLLAADAAAKLGLIINSESLPTLSENQLLPTLPEQGQPIVPYLPPAFSLGPTNTTLLSSLKSLNARLEFSASVNANFIRNLPSSSPARGKYVPGTPAWTKLQIEVTCASHPFRPPTLPNIACPVGTQSRSKVEEDVGDNIDGEESLQRIKDFAVDVEAWDVELSAQLAARKQLIYMQMAEDVDKIMQQMERAGR